MLPVDTVIVIRNGDSLETRAEPAVFSLQLEFRKLLEPSPREPALNINKMLRETTKQYKVKGLT